MRLTSICDCPTKDALVCKEHPDCRPSYCKMRMFDMPIVVSDADVTLRLHEAVVSATAIIDAIISHTNAGGKAGELSTARGWCGDQAGADPGSDAETAV